MSRSVTWQLTRSCDLECDDCLVADERAENKTELSTFESYKTIDQIAAAKPERFVISGGDPLARKDIFELVQYARRRGLDPAVTVSPTKALTAENVNKLRRNGLMRLIFSLNGSSPQKHDAVSGVAGAFATTVRGMRWAHDAGIKVEVNTLISRETVDDLAAIAEVIDPFRIDAWNIYFLVPLPAVRKLHAVSAEQAEEAMAALSAIASLARYRVRVMEHAPHPPLRGTFSRWEKDREGGPSPIGRGWREAPGEGRDIFITADGEVRPSEFLPMSAGNLREYPFSTILRTMEAAL
jgi:MoaA/NifB/PqqE/SkfB family radical SAM enzyme